MKRRSYKIDSILVNGKTYSEVIIDPDYEEKHSEHINDELILALVRRLDGRRELPEDNTVYIGVVNAFRDGRGE